MKLKKIITILLILSCLLLGTACEPADTRKDAYIILRPSGSQERFVFSETECKKEITIQYDPHRVWRFKGTIAYSPDGPEHEYSQSNNVIGIRSSKKNSEGMYEGNFKEVHSLGEYLIIASIFSGNDYCKPYWVELFIKVVPRMEENELCRISEKII